MREEEHEVPQEELDSAVELHPFALRFDGTDGFTDFRPVVEVVNPKEPKQAPAVVTSAEPETQTVLASQDELPFTIQTPTPKQAPVTPEVETPPVEVPNKPELRRHDPKEIIIPNAR